MHQKYVYDAIIVNLEFLNPSCYESTASFTITPVKSQYTRLVNIHPIKMANGHMRCVTSMIRKGRWLHKSIPLRM